MPREHIFDEAEYERRVARTKERLREQEPRRDRGRRSGEHELPDRLRRLVLLRPSGGRGHARSRRADMDRSRHGRRRRTGDDAPLRRQHPRVQRRPRSLTARPPPDGLRRRRSRRVRCRGRPDRIGDGRRLLHREVVHAAPAEPPGRRVRGRDAARRLDPCEEVGPRAGVHGAGRADLRERDACRPRRH